MDGQWNCEEIRRKPRVKAILSGIQVNNPAAVAFWLSDRQWGTYLRGIMIVFDLRK